MESDDGRSQPLVVASNRLPVSLRMADQQIEVSRSSGGLAAALGGVAGDTGFDWIGWPGCVVDEPRREEVVRELEQQRLVPVFLTAEQELLYYSSLSNHTIWPLFHYFTERVDFQEDAWQSYVDVNHRFATALARCAPEGARVWIHDFHLMLLPQLLRELRHDVEIGFFLHIPFPSSEIYRLLPTREQLLRGVLGADHVGFHTADYARHFRSTCVRMLGIEVEREAVHFDGRRVGVGVHPIGIDVGRFDAALEERTLGSRILDLRAQYGSRKVVLGIERLDYTKGIAHKFRAFERLLEKRPDLAGRVTLLQVIVPSRLANPDYAGLKRELEEMVGRINGRFASPGVTPIEYIHGELGIDALTSLYRFADIGFVTPLRDGMNLVAQEYVLCQEPRATLPPAEGMLVLSELAGAAQVLPHAVLVNPWDTEGMARALELALEMPAGERSERMAAMAARVRSLECGEWASGFLDRLHAAATRNRASSSIPLRGTAAMELIDRWNHARRRFLFLDYDGTLRELTRTPEDAVPGPALRELLRELSRDPRNSIHVVSGRRRLDLERWLGDLGVHLCAEHGFAWRDVDTRSWHEIPGVDLTWLPEVEAVLTRVSEEVPGTLVERKACALAWHYRLADPDYGAWRARELLSELELSLSRLPVEVVHGHRVIEVRPAGVNKGGYVTRVLDAARVDDVDSCIACFGDDRTDLDMFRAMPDLAFVVQVGPGVEFARYRIESPAHVRELLARLAPSGVESI